MCVKFFFFSSSRKIRRKKINLAVLFRREWASKNYLFTFFCMFRPGLILGFGVFKFGGGSTVFWGEKFFFAGEKIR